MPPKTAEACRDRIKALLSENPLLSLNQIAVKAGITVRAAKIYTDEILNDQGTNEK